MKKAGFDFSMDGKGRRIDNVFVERLWRSVKYKEVYLKTYETVTEAHGIASAPIFSFTIVSASTRA